MATYTKEKDVESTVEEDPQARSAMEEVFGNTARWPQGFKGFTADITVNRNGQTETGSVTVKGPQEIEVSLQEEKLKKFASENLSSIAGHRGFRTFAESDGKYKLNFGDEDNHPLGRRVYMGGDGMSSFYRIKEGRIRQINRKTPRFSFSINIEDSVKNADGKFLTREYTVFYMNPETKKINDAEKYTDLYTRVGEADLPQCRRVINCEDGEVVVNEMTLANHKLL